jgi:hypothetical protein
VTTRAAPFIVAALFLIVVACASPSLPFSFENATGEEITIRVNDRLRLLIKPGETKSFNTPNNKGARRVVAIDAKGVTRVDRVYSWEELEAVDFHLVIR